MLVFPTDLMELWVILQGRLVLSVRHGSISVYIDGFLKGLISKGPFRQGYHRRLIYLEQFP